jgi:hypothetical protein
MRITILSAHPASCFLPASPAHLRLIAENAAEEDQIKSLLANLKQGGATVSQYGQPTSADYMAVGLEVELAPSRC